jgi:predicted nucleic acid-binding protein
VTQRWWQTERSKYGLFISEVVEVECARGDPELAARRRAVLSDVVLFPIDEKDTEISKKMMIRGPIPANAGPDAVHIAAAAIEQCAYLLTWNFRHIANAQIR